MHPVVRTEKLRGKAMWAPLPPEVLSRLRGLMSPEGMMDWDRAVREINDYRTLSDDYDGQGAKAPSPETFDAAVELAREFIPSGVFGPTYVTVGPNGSVNLDWEFAGGVSVSIEVTDPGEADVFLLTPDREPGYWVLNQTASV